MVWLAGKSHLQCPGRQKRKRSSMEFRKIPRLQWYLCHQQKAEFEKGEAIVQPQMAAQGLDGLFQTCWEFQKRDCHHQGPFRVPVHSSFGQQISGCCGEWTNLQSQFIRLVLRFFETCHKVNQGNESPKNHCLTVSKNSLSRVLRNPDPNKNHQSPRPEKTRSKNRRRIFWVAEN